MQAARHHLAYPALGPTKIRFTAFFAWISATLRQFGFRPLPLIFLCVLTLNGCATTPPVPLGVQPLTPILHHQYYQIYLVDTGWHTGYAFPAQTTFRFLPELKPWYPNARYLLVGWGNRAYYMSANPGAIKTFLAIATS
ncbi:DUF2459 domain-containing protein [Acidithiobacillus sp. IBUN Pt1247-S3]|uniref:DUF2459 domain-containing protein n=1 Tax=Acidithiobacillus sp. IBUN Pt1247-S3 TaxID=3166642 RepID=UPI0034E37A0B